MKLSVVLLIAVSIAVVSCLADPQSRGKPRFKTQIRSRTGTASRVEAKPKTEFVRDFSRTAVRVASKEPSRVSIKEPSREANREREFIIRQPATTTEIAATTEATTFITEPKPISNTPKIENNFIETTPTTEFPSYANATAQFTALPATAGCEQNDLLNRLLLRVLLSSMMTTTTTQNPLMENLNRLFNINPSQAASPTTVVTSTAVSTVTQLFSTIVSVMFRNRRLPTTIYSSSTLVVTEIQTITSTLPSFEPSSLFRLKREVGIENDLQSTVVEPQSFDKEIHPTRPLTSTPVISLPGSNEPAIDIDRLMLILNQPEIQEAWNKFLQVLSKVLE